MQLCRFSDEHLPPFKHIYRIFKSINNLSTKTKLGWTLFLSRNNSTAIAITYKTLWCVVYLLNIFKRCAVFWQFHCRVLNRNSKLFVFYFMQLDNNSRLFGHLSPLVPYLTTLPLSLVHRLQLLKNRQPFLRSVVAMWLSRMMKMKCSFGNSFFVCFCKSLSLVSLLATNYSSLFIDKRTLLCSQYSQMYTI